MTKDSGRRLQESRKLRQTVYLLMPVPLMIASFAAFSPLPQGRWIAFCFVVPIVVTYALALVQRKDTSYCPSQTAAVLLALAGLTAAAFLSLPFAWLTLDEPLFWQTFGTLSLALIFGLLAGLHRQDATALQKAQQRRFRASPGLLTVHIRIASGFGMAPPARPGIIDWLIRGAFGLYTAVIIIGAFLGGAAGLIILELIRPFVAADATLDTHATAMIGLGMIAVPPIGFILPALWRAWRGVRALEAEAAGPDGQFDMHWID